MNREKTINEMMDIICENVPCRYCKMEEQCHKNLDNISLFEYYNKNRTVKNWWIKELLAVNKFGQFMDLLGCRIKFR